MNLKRVLRFIRFYTDLKSIYFNFKTLPLRQALKLPITCASNVRFKSIKGKIFIEDAHLFRGMIEIGYGNVTHIDYNHPKTLIDLKGSIIFKGPAHIGHCSNIRVEGTLELGSRFRITAKSTIIAKKRVVFGDNCLLSWDVLIMDTDFHKIMNSEGYEINKPKDIVIGNNVWIGCRCTILKGSEVGNNCVIAANALISKSYKEESCIIAGQPGKVVRDNISWVV